jgi:hypothetical protein
MRAYRRLIIAEQDGRCLVCRHALDLACHLHHVIAWKYQGPDHPLNLVGLCPTHHTVLEHVRRHVAPEEKRGKRDWFRRARAAAEHVDGLPEPERALFMHLCEPHPLRKEIAEHIADRKFSRLGQELQGRLARDIARADAAMLVGANKTRARMVLSLARDAEAVAPSAFKDIIALHLAALGLPFKPLWLDGTWGSIDYEPP